MTDSQPTTEVARFADVAMFKAEPLKAADGPGVFVLSMNPDPLGSIAAAALMYKGIVIRDLGDVTDDQRREMFEQIRLTKLKAPFEFVKLHMLFENVHRGLTHQLVRQRTAVYAQESMRFAVKEGMAAATHMPPSIQGLKADDPRRVIWDQTLDAVERGYDALINAGTPAEDARGLAPTNISTRVHYSTDLRALLDHAGNRLCTQAQFEWRTLWLRIIPALRQFGSEQTYRKTDGTWASSAWQFDLLCSLFRPVCYLTGKCEFAAMDLDRACKIRDRVDANASIGRPSSEWDEEYFNPPAGDSAGFDGGHGVSFLGMPSAPGRVVEIAPIKPVEWLADPTAARVSA